MNNKIYLYNNLHVSETFDIQSSVDTYIYTYFIIVSFEMPSLKLFKFSCSQNDSQAMAWGKTICLISVYNLPLPLQNRHLETVVCFY